MRREEAEVLVSDFFARFGKKSAPFEFADSVKANIGETVIGFEYRNDKGILACSALIYRFRREPRPAVLREIEKAAAAGADTGGGEIVFDAENLTLSLCRKYSEMTEPLKFTAQMQRLATASLLWSSQILDRIADKVAEN